MQWCEAFKQKYHFIIVKKDQLEGLVSLIVMTQPFEMYKPFQRCPPLYYMIIQKKRPVPLNFKWLKYMLRF